MDTQIVRELAKDVSRKAASLDHARQTSEKSPNSEAASGYYARMRREFAAADQAYRQAVDDAA